MYWFQSAFTRRAADFSWSRGVWVTCRFPKDFRKFLKSQVPCNPARTPARSGTCGVVGRDLGVLAKVLSCLWKRLLGDKEGARGEAQNGRPKQSRISSSGALFRQGELFLMFFCWHVPLSRHPDASSARTDLATGMKRQVLRKAYRSEGNRLSTKRADSQSRRLEFLTMPEWPRFLLGLLVGALRSTSSCGGLRFRSIRSWRERMGLAEVPRKGRL